MKTEPFSMYDAVLGIPDVRYIVAITFGTTDLPFIKKVLNMSGYPFGTPESWAKQLLEIHNDWLSNGKTLEGVKGYLGCADPWDKLEKTIAERAKMRKLLLKTNAECMECIRMDSATRTIELMDLAQKLHYLLKQGAINKIPEKLRGFALVELQAEQDTYLAWGNSETLSSKERDELIHKAARYKNTIQELKAAWKL